MGIQIDIKKKLGDFELDIQMESGSSRIGILGASGCGKSMTLKSIAGIETPDSGFISVGEEILFDSRKKVNIRPQKRSIGYLFQNYALFPHMTVEQNIAAGLKGGKAQNQERVREMIRKFRLEGLERHLPGQLSGGQQQRTALARIMAYEPEVILLDEPFSALDGFLKDRLQLELEEMLKDYKGTIVMVSHNRDEVYRLCEELVILENGKVVVSGKTKEIFADPKYREAAKLTGCKNFTGIRRIDAHQAELTDWGIRLKLKREIPSDCTSIGYRAHDFVPVWGERKENCFRLQVRSVAKLPFEVQYYLVPEPAQKKPAEENVQNSTFSEMGSLDNKKGKRLHRKENNAKESNIEESGIKEDIICWFVQRDKQPMLEERGLPDYLQIAEESCMFLK